MVFKDLKHNLYTFSKAIRNRNKHFFFNSLLAIALFLGIASFLNRITLKGNSAVKIEVKMKLLRDDDIQLFYLPEGEKDYQEKYSFEKSVAGKSAFQTLTWELADSVKVRQLRLDLGSDKRQKNIEIESIVLSYNDHCLPLFRADGHTNYFDLNKFIKKTGKGEFEPVVADKYDPFMYSRDLDLEYNDLVKSKKRIPYANFISFILVLGLWIYLSFYAGKAEFITRFYTAASCFFVLLLLLPFLNEVFEVYKSENQELRNLANKPVLKFDSLLSYPSRFEKYYNDNFGFRDLLVKLGGKIKYHVFNSSFVPEKTSVGKKGWLFLDGSFYWITQDLTRANLFTAESLTTTVAEWERRKEVLKKDSIFYYRSFWPDKHYIYPEYMSMSMKIIEKDTILRCDQAINYLKEKKSDLHIIDVRPVLQEGKKTKQIYQKYDSHWNSYGAFIAYSKLMEEISKDFPELKPFPLSDFTISWKPEEGGDLANVLGINVTEIMPNFSLKRGSMELKELPADGFPKKTKIYQNEHAATKLTLLMYRDSYTDAMIPFLNLHFAKMILLWNAPYEDQNAKNVNANIVVEAFASRYF